MKSNRIALTALSCICLGLATLAPLHATSYEVKGGNDHHDEHSTPHSNGKPESNMPMHEGNDAVESEVEAVNSNMPDQDHDASHGEVHDDHSTQGGGSSEAHHGGGHGHHGAMAEGPPWFHHGAIEVSEVFHLSLANLEESSVEIDMETPSVTVMVHPDTRKGWNIEVQTEYFSFAPEQVNQANQPNVGHGHLYVDGEKITRLYGNWFYLEHLESGTHDITVSLHANGHEVWTHEGEAIAHTVTVDVP